MSAESGSAAAAEPTAVVFSATLKTVVVPANTGGSFTSVRLIVTAIVSSSVLSETVTVTE